MNEIKVLIAVGHSLKEPWLTIFRDGSELTWVNSKLPSEFELVNFHGYTMSKFWTQWDFIHEKIRWKNRWVAAPLRWFDALVGLPYMDHIPSTRVSKSLKSTHLCLEVKCKDVYQFMRWKDLAILDYFVNQTTAEYLFSTTNNSYINFNGLRLITESLPKTNLYAGVKAYQGANFAAGNNRILSRDVATAVLKNKRLFSPGYIEDVALGKIIKKLGFDLFPLKSLVLNSIQELENTSNEELLANYHFRVKSGSINSRNDVAIMLRLHARLLGLGAL